MKGIWLALVAASLADAAQASPAPAPEGPGMQPDPRLELVAHSDRLFNAVTVSADGRLFVAMPPVAGEGPQVAELVGDAFVPYPDLAWSLWHEGADPHGTLLHVNTVRIGPDGDLWVVDAGSPQVGAKAVPGAAKVASIDLRSNRIRHVYAAEPGQLREYSYLNDIRFNGGHAYIADSAADSPGLLVLDLQAGTMRRVLDDHPSMLARAPVRDEHGRLVPMGHAIPDGRGHRTRHMIVHVDHLEVSPDGAWLYYEPVGGPLWRVPTRLLDDPAVPPPVLAGAVEKYVDTWIAGGSAIDAAGNIYLTDRNRRRVMTITPTRTVVTLVADPRLVGPDAMWVGADGRLYIPTVQFERSPPGPAPDPAYVPYGSSVYGITIGARPAPNDHR